jgi:hypothetical protein
MGNPERQKTLVARHRTKTNSKTTTHKTEKMGATGTPPKTRD